MTNKNISKFGKIFEITVFEETTNQYIYETIKKEITDFLDYDKRLIPDFNAFDTISKYLDWKSLLLDFQLRK